MLDQKKPNLSCSQQADKFTVGTEKGNGKLIYPVGLITIDEAAFAGGTNGDANSEYYLYTGQTYWTMSPYLFYLSRASALVWLVTSDSYLNATWVTASGGVRPVINLKNGIKALSGDGTASNPYVIG